MWLILHTEDIVTDVKLRGLRWAGNVTSKTKTRNACRILAKNPHGKRPLARQSRRMEDSVKLAKENNF
jgi:hypothetical protein